MDALSPKPDVAAPAATTRKDTLRAAAVSLEASFLSEMLQHTGVARPPDFGSGGPGEDAFAGFLSTAYADALAQRGGIGLSEHIFQALLRQDDGIVP